MINHYLENVDDDTFKLWKIDFNIDIMKNSTKKELINIFKKYSKINLYYQVVLTLMILKAYKSLIKFIKVK
jgi:RNA recognition motif-containing protein